MWTTSNKTLILTECPRDAWQGIRTFIPTALKVQYLQMLLEADFSTLDAGSFVSAKAVPQVSDTREVLNRLSLDKSHSKLLVIIANTKGAEEACLHEKVSCLGYPFSISEIFQHKNANSTIAESFERVKSIKELCGKYQKELVIYISMGFGNPYGEPWNEEITAEWVAALAKQGITRFSIADTAGKASPLDIRLTLQRLFSAFPGLSIGAHFHSRPESSIEKINAAFDSGCRRYDSTIAGFGGCPFADDELVGNISTETLLSFAAQNNSEVHLNMEAYKAAQVFFKEKIAPYQGY